MLLPGLDASLGANSHGPTRRCWLASCTCSGMRKLVAISDRRSFGYGAPGRVLMCRGPCFFNLSLLSSLLCSLPSFHSPLSLSSLLSPLPSSSSSEVRSTARVRTHRITTARHHPVDRPQSGTECRAGQAAMGSGTACDCVHAHELDRGVLSGLFSHGGEGAGAGIAVALHPPECAYFVRLVLSVHSVRHRI